MQQHEPTKRELVAALSRARKATLRLIKPVDVEQLVGQVSPIVSPLAGTSPTLAGSRSSG